MLGSTSGQHWVPGSVSHGSPFPGQVAGVGRSFLHLPSVQTPWPRQPVPSRFGVQAPSSQRLQGPHVLGHVFFFLSLSLSLSLFLFLSLSGLSLSLSRLSRRLGLR